MNRKHVVIVGSSFAGFTAAIELKRRLGDHHDVTVISKSDQFLFMPSLVWVPFGLRAKEDITFAVRPRLEAAGVRFRHDEVTRLDLGGRVITTRNGQERYDYLVLATGSKPNYGAIPGLGPRGYTQSIMSLHEAERARAAFEAFLAAPGPVVVGSVQGASCFTAAYEFLFAMACELRKHGLASQAPLTYVTPEPPGSAADIAEQFIEKLDVRRVSCAAVQEISPGAVHLADGRTLPFDYAMLVPPSLGVDVVRACEKITSASGFVRVNGFCQTERYPEVFAAGVAIAAERRGGDLAPFAGPQSGFLAEETGRLVAHNIAAQMGGEEMISRSPAGIGGALDASPDRAKHALHEPAAR
jgi:sulfide:quinone oxidoreductase